MKGLQNESFVNWSKVKEADIYSRYALDEARKMTGIDFRVLMVDSLKGNTTIEDFAVQSFKDWGVGVKTGGKGVLCVIDFSQKKVKIEVGYELEAYFPDVYLSSFQDTLRNYFAGNFLGDVISSMITQMSNKYVERDKTALFSVPASHGVVSQKWLSGGAGISKKFTASIEEILAEQKAKHRGKLEHLKASSDPEVSAQRYIQSLEEGSLCSWHPLLTQGSQLMMMEYPKGASYQRNEAKPMIRYGEYFVEERGDLAVARFEQNRALPIFMRRGTDGLWYVDRVSSWLHSYYDSREKKASLIDKDIGWMFAYPELKRKAAAYPTPPLYSVDDDLLERIEELNRSIAAAPQEKDNYRKLAELFYYECYWIAAATDTAEKLLEIDPSYYPIRHLILSMGYRYPYLERHQLHYEALISQEPQRSGNWFHYKHFAKTYLKDPALEKRIAKREEEYLKNAEKRKVRRSN